ncbi:MAG: isoprenylcysteine carboxylmethyltransferase family protein [Planctomycetia bacterium]|nr:isoprenylcysteine carboxylmethyltransferase family protein [Planctomycetia bacterium]
MPLREEWEAQGNWLFRWRSYLPIGLCLLFAWAVVDFRYAGEEHAFQEALMAGCLLVSCSGLVVRALVVGYAPKGTSGRNTAAGQIAEQLNVAGMYSVVRHPLYVGNFLIWLGIPLFFHNAWLLMVFCLVYWLYYERIMFAEEEFLRRKFGAEYVRWAAQTPAFIPRLTGWQQPTLPFSWRNVLRREYTALFGILMAFAGLEVLEHAIVEGRLEIETHWRVLIPLAVVVYVGLRSLKRHTRLLAEAGR